MNDSAMTVAYHPTPLHHPEVAGGRPPSRLGRILRCGLHRPMRCRRKRHGLGRQSGDGGAVSLGRVRHSTDDDAAGAVEPVRRCD